MSIIIRLQNLPWSANSLDIRKYFHGLSIPEGGVHIVGGEKGDAFIAFSTDEDARQAMERDCGKVKDIKIKLLLSSRTEMQKVIEQARSQCMPPLPPVAAPPPVSKPSRDRDRSRSPEPNRRSSPERRRERDRSPRDRDRDRDKSKSSSSSSKSSSRKEKSRSRSPRKTRDRDRDRDRDQDKEKDKDKDKDKEKDRRSSSSKRDDRKRSDDSSKSKEESSRHDSGLDNRSVSYTPQPSNGASVQFQNSISSRSAPSRSSLPAEQPFSSRPFSQPIPQPTNIDPWIDKVPVWEAPRLPVGNTLPVDNFRPAVQAEFRGRDTFPRNNDSFSVLDSFNSRPESVNDRGRFVAGLDQAAVKSFGLPPVFEAANNLRRQEQYGDSGSSFPTQSAEEPMQIGKSYSGRAFDSDQRMVSTPQVQPQMVGGNPSQDYGDRLYDSGLARGLGYCIEVRGLPYSVSYKDVRDLFRSVYIATDALKLINDETGQRAGTALIRLTNQRDVNEALKRNKQYVGDSYIDVFRCSDQVFDQAIDSYLPPGMKKPIPPIPYSQMPPLPDDLCVLLKGLPYGCTEDEVIHFFDGLRILDIYIETEYSGRGTGCGFVEFGTIEDFHAAMAMNRQNIGHRYIDLSIASKDMMQASRRLRGALDIQALPPPVDRDRVPPKELLPLPQLENRNSLCVGLQGLPFNVTDRDIAEFFAEIAVPQAIHIMLGPNRIPTGDAYVEFANIQHFEMALTKNGKFVGQNMVKLFRIPYEEMMEILGTPVVRKESLLGRPLNESRVGQLDDQDIMSRQMMNRPRPGVRDLDDASNSPRHSLVEPRGFPRDSHPLRGIAGDLTRDGLPSRIDIRDGLPHRPIGLSEPRDGMSRNYTGDLRDPLPSRILPGDLRDPLPSRGLPGDLRDPLPTRGLPGDLRDPLSSRGLPGDLRGSHPLRGLPGDLRDPLPSRGLPGDLRDPLPSRGLPGDMREPIGRLIMDQDRGLPHRGGFLGDQRDRPARRQMEPEFVDDADRHRRFPVPDDISTIRRPDSPDSRGHGRLSNGPIERPSDGKPLGRHIDKPQSPLSDDLHDHGPPRGPGGDYGIEGRMPRGPPIHGGPPPRRMPPNGQAPIVPEGFGKPGCVIGAGNIQYRATVDELLSLFKDYSLTKDKIIRRYDNMGRVTGDARIAFASTEEAQKVVTELNGKMFNGRPISLFVM